MKTQRDAFALCDQIREASFALHWLSAACRVEHGLLINFGATELGIEEYALSALKRFCAFCAFLRLYLNRYVIYLQVDRLRLEIPKRTEASSV